MNFGQRVSYYKNMLGYGSVVKQDRDDEEIKDDGKNVHMEMIAPSALDSTFGNIDAEQLKEIRENSEAAHLVKAIVAEWTQALESNNLEVLQPRYRGKYLC